MKKISLLTAAFQILIIAAASAQSRSLPGNSTTNPSGKYNSMAIGANAFVSASNSVRIGSNTISSIGAGSIYTGQLTVS